MIILKNWKNKNKNLFEKLHFTSSTNLDSFPLQNKSLPIKDRVDDLVCIRCVLNKQINKLLWLFSNYVELKIRSSSQQPSGIYVKHDRLQP